MRVTMNFDSRGAQQDVRKWSERKQRDVKDTTNKSAINIQSGAKRRVRVDEGRLRSSIAIEPASTFGDALRVGTKVFYGPYIEWGTGIFSDHPEYSGRSTPWRYYNERWGRWVFTRGSKPHPFLLPAFEEEKPHYLAALRRVLST